MKRIFLLLLVIAALTVNAVTQSGDFNRPVVVALPERLTGLDTLSSAGTDAAAERIRELIYNSLVKKNENFEYVGELGDYRIGDDDLTVIFTLKDDVKFHDGKTLTAADVKYTFDALFQANGAKALSFYDYVPDKADPGATKRIAHLESIAVPDAKTVIFKVTRVEFVNQLLSNLTAIPIIPESTIERQKTAPVGTGAFRFVSYDQTEVRVELEAFPEHWEGAPKIQKLIVKTVADASALRSGLLSGGVDLVLNPWWLLAPDELKTLGETQNLAVEYFAGSSIQYIGFNTRIAPFDNAKVRQAAAYAIDREKIVENVLDGRAAVAHSILPAESWAYAAGTKYFYDPAKSRQLLKSAGYKGKIVKLTFYSGNQTINRQAQAIRNMLKDAGFNVAIETMEPHVLLEKLRQGDFQMNIGTWIGGNQDPVFYRDLFASTNSPERKRNGRNRARYSNPEFDKIIEAALRATDKTKAKELYARAQAIVSRDVPLLPLWYPTGIVVSNKRIKNINVKPGGDWSFVRFIESGD